MHRNDEGIFYRALSLPGMLKRWEDGLLTSSHRSVPHEWSDLFYSKKIVEPNAYPLECASGIFTPSAVQSFLRLAPSHRRVDVWPEAESTLLELDGVCAFENPLDAFRYGRDSGASPYDRYVEFWGSFQCSPPEPGGVVAKVLKKIGGPMTAEEFARKHNLKM